MSMVRLTEGGLMIRESARNGFSMESEAIVQKIEKDGQPSKGIIKRGGNLVTVLSVFNPSLKGYRGPGFF